MGNENSGNHTLYKTEYCRAIIAHCEQGSSIASFARKCGVSRATLYNWRKDFPEFDLACDHAYCAALEFWEKLLVAAATGTLHTAVKDSKGAHPTSIMFALKNRFNEIYSERHVVENTGTVNFGGSIDISAIKDPAKLLELAQQLADRESALTAKLARAASPDPLKGTDTRG